MSLFLGKELSPGLHLRRYSCTGCSPRSAKEGPLFPPRAGNGSGPQGDVLGHRRQGTRRKVQPRFASRRSGVGRGFRSCPGRAEGACSGVCAGLRPLGVEPSALHPTVLHWLPAPQGGSAPSPWTQRSAVQTWGRPGPAVEAGGGGGCGSEGAAPLGR